MSADPVIFESANGKIFHDRCGMVRVQDFTWTGSNADTPPPGPRFAAGLEADLAAEIERLWAELATVTRIYPPAAPAEVKPGTLNLDHDEARALHRIVRAMHDGECPKCHIIVPASVMRTRFKDANPDIGRLMFDGCKCPACGFAIDDVEAREVLSIFAPFMERNLAIFEQWRQNRIPATVAGPAGNSREET